jgi:hypothetical protein
MEETQACVVGQNVYKEKSEKGKGHYGGIEGVIEQDVEGLEHAVVPWNITQFLAANKNQDKIQGFICIVYNAKNCKTFC